MLKKGFTLIEILSVVAIIAILILVATSSLAGQRRKGDDAKMKADLNRLKIAFEDYYNDHNCYPPPSWFTTAANCGSTILAPYLNTLACNPHTGLPYPVETDSNGGCTWFKIYTNLTDPNDPQLLTLTYTQNGATKTANYGVSSTNISLLPTPTPAASTNPVPQYYCQALSNCSLYDPTRFRCTPSYLDPNCGSSNQCTATVGTCTPI